MSATDRCRYSGMSWATNAMPSRAAGDPAGSPPSTLTLAGGRRRQPDHEVEQGGLARAVRARPARPGDRRGWPACTRAAPRCRRTGGPGRAVSMTFMPRLRAIRPGLARAPRASSSSAALREIPQRAGEQRDDPVLVQPGRVGVASQSSSELAQPGRARGASTWLSGGLDERALPGPARRQALVLQLAVGLQHRVRVDRQVGDHVPDLGQLITRLEVAQPQRVLDLLDELQVGRHPRGRVQPELDRRQRPARPPQDRCPLYLVS